jgi:hypothetical protein
VSAVEVRPISSNNTITQTISGRTGSFGFHVNPAMFVRQQEFVNNLEEWLGTDW